MALNFPSSPSNGDTYVRLGRGWKYNSTSGAWEALINVNTAFDSDDISEGTSNLYSTQERTDDFVSNLITAGNNITVNYNDAANSLTIDAATPTTISGNAGTATALQTARDFSATGDATAPAVSFDGTANVALNLTLANTAVSAGIYGSGSAIPVITVDSKGRITSASTQSVNIVTTTDIAGDSGTDTITLGTDTLTFAGTTSEIETAVTNNQVQIGLPNDVTIGNNLTVTGTLTVNGTTTTINSTQLDVDDLNITIASGAANASAANGAGITVDGANATLTYTSSNDRWNFNKELVVARVHGNVTGNVTGQVSDISNFSTTNLAEGTNLYYTDARADARATLRITAASIGNLSDVDITTSAPTNGQVLVWNASNSEFEPGTITGYATSNFNTDFASKDTDDLSEGTTNLYYTNTRVNSFLTGGTVSVIRTSDLDIKNTAGTEQIASFAQNGSVALYYDNSNKFATTTNGIRVTGNIVISSNTSQYFDEDYVVDNYSDTHEVTFTANNITADRTISFPDASGTIVLTGNSIGVLADVDITTSAPTNGQSLIWNASGGKFVPGNVSGYTTTNFNTDFGNSSIGGLSDVTISGITNGQSLIWSTSNSRFEPGASSSVAALSDLNDVDTSGVSNGQILKYVSASSEFQPSFVTNSMLDPTNVFVDQFTAGGSSAQFTLSSDPGSKNAIQVFVDGVPQKTSGLTVVGTTLTLAGTPTNGQIVEVRGYGVGLPIGTVADNSITGAKLQDNTIGLSKISASNYYTADTFTAGSNQTAYTLSVDPGSPYAITVYVANVWQKPVTNYTVSGTTMTLASAPTAGVEVYVRYYGVALNVGTVADASITGVKLQDGTITVDKIAAGAYQKQTFTGDNTTTAFTLSTDPGVAQALLVMVDNVVQEPTENYTTSGTTLTFTSAPALNARIYVRYLGLPYANASVPADDSVTNAKLNLTYTSNQYTGNNSTTAYTIPAGHTANSILVILDGLILPPSDYSVSGTTLTFGSAPLLNQSIDIRYMPV